MKQLFFKMMRLSIILILLTSCLSKKITAQSLINIRSGLNYSWLYDMGIEGNYRYGKPEFDSKPAYYLGVSYYKSKNKLIQFESTLDLCSKFVSIDGKSGGIVSVYTIDTDFKLYYANISFYPTIRLGNKLEFVGSVRPYFAMMFTSSRNGTESYWTQPPYPNEPPISYSWTSTGESDEFLKFSLDLAINVRMEYNLTEKLGLLLEYQYSKGFINVSECADFQFNFKNVIVGAGIILQLAGSSN